MSEFNQIASQFGWAVGLLVMLIGAIGLWIWKWVLPRMDRLESRSAQQAELHRQEMRELVNGRAADSREMLVRFSEMANEMSGGFKETARGFQQTSAALERLSGEIEKRRKI